MSAATPGRAALDALDKALSEKPHRDEHALTHATVCLTAFRDALIGEHRGALPSAADRQRLAHLNSVLSVVLSGHFPLGATPWGELEKARGWLAELVQERA